MNLKQLKEPFDPSEIKWRVGSQSKKGDHVTLLAYIDARAAMDRLDDVVGPGNWKDSYTQGPDGGYLCTVSIKIDDEWVSKSDGAEGTKVEAIKGGYSDSFKRACVKWGIGRYLYSLDANFHKLKDGYGPDHAVKHKGKHVLPPKLPSWALPKGTRTAQEKKDLKEVEQAFDDAPPHAIKLRKHLAEVDACKDISELTKVSSDFDLSKLDADTTAQVRAYRSCKAAALTGQEQDKEKRAMALALKKGLK